MSYMQRYRLMITGCLWMVLTALLANGSTKLSFNETIMGRATKCDKKDDTKVSVTWKPYHLSPSGQVETHISYQAPYNMSKIYLNASLYFHQEAEPFVGYSNVFTCDDLKELKKLISCPILRRTYIAFPYNVTNLHVLTSFPGDYDLVIEIRNENNQVMLCLNMTLHVDEL